MDFTQKYHVQYHFPVAACACRQRYNRGRFPNTTHCHLGSVLALAFATHGGPQGLAARIAKAKARARVVANKRRARKHVQETELQAALVANGLHLTLDEIRGFSGYKLYCNGRVI